MCNRDIEIRKLKKSLTTFFLFFLVSCASTSDFKVVEAKYVGNNDVLFIQFRSSSAIRSLSLNPKANVITFKGTTLKDLKWATSFDNVEYFTVDELGIFKLKPKEKDAFEFGVVNRELIPMLINHLGKYYK